MPVTVPLLDLSAQYLPLRTDLLAALTRVCDSQVFIGGPEVDGLEHEIAAALQVPYAIGVSSGTDALLMTLMALGIGPGDEVITSTYSFFAAAEVIVRARARPVLVDIQPDTLNIDPVAVARAMTSRTRAIIPVHLFGQPADMDPILAAAAPAGATVIEDAAQAIGSSYKGRPTGSIGTFGCFSFFPSKNLGAFGDGGLVVCSDEGLATQLRVLRNHGMAPKYHHRVIGGNFRLDALQAAVLRVKLPHVPAWCEARRRNAARYRRLFSDAALEGVVALPHEAPDRVHVYNQFVVRVQDRDRLREHLTHAGIGTEIYYPAPFHTQPCLADLGLREGAFPVAEAAARESLALPIYGELSESQQSAVVEAVRSFYGQP